MKRPIALLIATTAAMFGRVAAGQEMPEVPKRTVSSEAAQNNAGPPPNVGELMRHSNGSLYRASAQMADDPRLIKPSDVSYFNVPVPKPKTLNKHDLVTIVVFEDSTASSQGTSDLKRDSEVDGKIIQTPSLNLSNFALGAGIGSVQPELSLSGVRSFKGEGTVDRHDSFTARIQAEVVDVKPNGTLVLQARKRILNDEEQQMFILTGICRVQDITPDNTVLSTQLFDFDVQKKTTGSLRDTTKRGWVPKLLDWISPF